MTTDDTTIELETIAGDGQLIRDLTEAATGLHFVTDEVGDYRVAQVRALEVLAESLWGIEPKEWAAVGART